MAIARVTGQDNSGIAGTVTFPGTPTSGNTIRIDIYVNGSPGAVTMPAGWTMKKESACGSTAANGSVSRWEKVAGASEPTTVAITTAAGTIRWLTTEYSGVATSSADDGTGTASGGTGTSAVTSHATGGLTTANADDLVSALFGFSGNITAASATVDAGFSVLPQSVVRLVAVDRIVSATGTYNPTLSWGTAQRAGGIITALKAAVPIKTGSGSGTWTFVGTAAGKRTPKASCTGSWTFAGTAAGTRAPKASGSGSWAFAGAATGARTPKATAAGTWSFTGTAAGTTARSGTGAGSWTFAGAAAGTRPPKASGAGTFAFLGTAAGVSPRSGSGAGSWLFTGTGTGTEAPKGTGTGQFSFTGSAVGKTVSAGTGAGSWLFIGTAAGVSPPTGPARDITATATLAPRRWTTQLAPRTRTADLTPRRWKATLP